MLKKGERRDLIARCARMGEDRTEEKSRDSKEKKREIDRSTGCGVKTDKMPRSGPGMASHKGQEERIGITRLETIKVKK